MKDLWKGVVAGSAILLLVACIPAANIFAGNLQRRAMTKQKRVNELYNKNCARCHGADGRSDTPLGKSFSAPNFTDADWWKKNSAVNRTKTMKAVIVRGKGGMPAFGKKLKPVEINLLLERMKQFRNSTKTVAG